MQNVDALNYFDALVNENLLMFNDTHNDPRCEGLIGKYLENRGIRAMVDTPYQFNGQLAGVLCLEHVDEPRQWTRAEQHFCTNMASLLTIASEREHRRQTEFALREEEDRYRSLVNDLPMGLVMVVNRGIVFANRASAEILHTKDPDEVVGRKISELLPLAAASDFDDWEELNHAGQLEPQEYRVRLWDDAVVTLEITTTSVSWYGRPAIQAVFRDVTESFYAQKRLKRSERLLSQAQRIARLGSWVWDLKADRTECSLELRNLLGLKQGSTQRSPIISMAHAEGMPRLIAAQEKAISTKTHYEITYRVNTRTGILWLEETGVPELGPNQEIVRIHGTSRDITRQKFAELEAKVTEERFSALGNSFPGGFFYCDLSARYLFINETYADWFGISASDYLGKPVSELVGHAAYLEYEPYISSVTGGRSVTFERTPPFKKDNIEKLQYTLAPDISVSGEMHGFFGLLTDITEIEQVEQALRQAQKMEAMGQLTGGIAHDFNNILAILMGNLELAKHTSTEPEAQEYIAAAMQGVERGALITQKLLGFARSKTEGMKNLSLNEVINDIRNMVTQSIGSRVYLNLDIADEVWRTLVDRGDFEDAVLNLCHNARDAMPSGGRLMIKVDNRTLDDTSQRIHPALHPGDYVLISFTDTGIGMDPKTKDRLFEPFFTTKPEGKGTGLGMSMVFGFVKRSGGEIVVYSAIGEGTTINIYLPRSEENQGNECLDYAEQMRPVAKASILIVDDEEMVANVAASILRELGYSTQVTTNTRQALAHIKDNEDIDLIFSDVVMPDDLNGFEFAREAGRIRPELKVLLTSGFSKFKGLEPEDQDSKLLAQNILSKPYNRQELAASVRKILDSQSIRSI